MGKTSCKEVFRFPHLLTPKRVPNSAQNDDAHADKVNPKHVWTRLPWVTSNERHLENSYPWLWWSWKSIHTYICRFKAVETGDALFAFNIPETSFLVRQYFDAIGHQRVYGIHNPVMSTDNEQSNQTHPACSSFALSYPISVTPQKTDRKGRALMLLCCEGNALINTTLKIRN